MKYATAATKFARTVDAWLLADATVAEVIKAKKAVELAFDAAFARDEAVDEAAFQTALARWHNGEAHAAASMNARHAANISALRNISALPWHRQ